jgi:hypothetical protein
MMVKETNYKSPRHKLTKFFEKSRDQWKEKCLKAKSKAVNGGLIFLTFGGIKFPS